MRKIFLTLLAACLALGGCADSGSVMSTTAAPETTTYAAVEETETETAFTQEEEINASQEETKVQEGGSEIIMVVDNFNMGDISIYSINPKNGEKDIISSFTIYGQVISNSDGREWMNILSNISYSERAPLRGMFSKDYKYIAVTRYAKDTGECHAGYYDEERRFHDITAAIDAVGGDFDEPVIHISIGFTEEGSFLFAELPYSGNEWHGRYHTYDPNWKVYQVGLSENGGIIKSSMKPYNDLNRLQGDGWEWLEECCEVTDWLDETHCILNYPENTEKLLYGGMRLDRWGMRIFNTQTQEYSLLISGETRTNWSGVISPDGKSVAFLSAPLTGNGSASLYSVSIDGGEPVKICDDISVSRTSINNVMSRPNNSQSIPSGTNVVFLVDWANIP